MSWRRNLAQRFYLRAERLRERSLEIHPGTPLARRFAAFGEGSVIGGPQLRLENPHAIAIGASVTILRYACLEAYAPLDSVIVEIGDGCYFSHHFRVVAINGVQIGNHTAIGQYVTLADSVHDYKRDPGAVTWRAPLRVGRRLVIGSGVWLGHGVVVAGGLTVGDGAIVAPNAVVTRDVPAHTMVGGDPLRVLRRKEPSTGEWRVVAEQPLLVDERGA